MRLGCAGCLTFLLLAAAAAGAVWTGIRASGEPALTVDAGTAADGMRAQKKILDIARGRVPEGGRVVLTEGEINAFLTRHLADTADLPFGGVAVGFSGDGTVAFKGRVPMRRAVPLFSTAAGLGASASFGIIGSYSGRFPAWQSAVASSVFVFAGGVGSIVFPYLTGPIASAGGFRLALAMTAVPALAYAAFSLVIRAGSGEKPQ